MDHGRIEREGMLLLHVATHGNTQRDTQRETQGHTQTDAHGQETNTHQLISMQEWEMDRQTLENMTQKHRFGPTHSLRKTGTYRHRHTLKQTHT